jgi:hypothetical protein
MSEQRYGAGGIPLRPKVEVEVEEPEVVEEPAPAVKYTTTVTETESEELPEEVVDDTEVLEVGSKQ